MELRFDALQQLRRDRHPRRQRRDGEDAGVGDVARERAEEPGADFGVGSTTTGGRGRTAA
jgi:hypothetical protein